MSLSAALSNALSGLTATQRAASVVSNNISNALTEGYGRRQIELTARSGTSGGVSVSGVVRNEDRRLVGDWRLAEAALSNADAMTTYHQRMESLFGTPEDGNSLSGRLVAFENALVTATSRPDLPERLTGVLNAANDVAGTFNEISSGIQTIRQEADAEIGAAVNRVNTLLDQVYELNAQITLATNTGGDANALTDHRQSVINELSEIIPVIQTPRDFGAVALYTPGGAILLDGTAGTLGFDGQNIVTADMTQDNGLLSGLTLNGVPLKTGNDRGPIAGGRLSALFEIRDVLSVEAQARLDTAARDVVERFQDPALDATRAPGDPGLFTDAGAAFSAADEVGISGRIAVNAAVDPGQGGATWRLRDGLGAAAEGPSGDASLLNDLIDGLRAKRVPSSSVFGSGGLAATELASSLLSLAGTERNLAEQGLAFATTREGELKGRLLSDAVDTDQEMQNLLLIEQAYAANARLVQTVEDMLDILMRI